MPLLEPDHIASKLAVAHGIMVEVCDYLEQADEDEALRGFAGMTEEHIDELWVTFRNQVRQTALAASGQQPTTEATS